MSEEKGKDHSKELIDLVDTAIKEAGDLYEVTVNVLLEAIKAGKSNIPLGLMGFMVYCDFLHGGAYKGDASKLPYWMKDADKPAWVKNLNMPPLAKPEQVELLEDSNIPHIFPKLLSDQMFWLVKEWGSLFLSADLFGNLSTGLKTLVESPARLMQGVAQTGFARAKLLEAGATTSAAQEAES